MPKKVVELFGILGLIMIVLEAGLDLQLSRKKLGLVKNAFFSSLVILALSSIACALLLHRDLGENYLRCFIYAIPLSIVSSAIVIPSISHLQEHKKEFLIYETSFSDILGIMIFDYLIAGSLFEFKNISLFFGLLVIACLLSIFLSIFILFMLTKITTKVRYFLVFAVLIFLYAGGKLLHLPALMVILIFGLIACNWHSAVFKTAHSWIPVKKVNEVSHLLHALAAESSFLIRTFFFFIFGLTIDFNLLMDPEVITAGSSIVLALFLIRFIYLRFFLHSHIFPELFFMPRGLITILLFYSIPQAYRFSKFNEGILFFVIMATSILMIVGSISFGKPKLQAIHDEIPLAENEEM